MFLLVCMNCILNNSLIRGFLEKAIDSPLIHIIHVVPVMYFALCKSALLCIIYKTSSVANIMQQPISYKTEYLKYD